MVVLRDGVEETLTLPRDQQSRSRPRSCADAGHRAARAARSDAPPPAPLPRAARAAQDKPCTRRRSWQQTIDRARQNPEELAKRLQIVPVLDGGTHDRRAPFGRRGYRR